jgi:hypothetical protein
MGKQCAGAIMFYSALFANKPGIEQWYSEPLGNALRNQRIIGVWLLVAPSVETDMRDRKFACVIPHKSRAGIATPQIIGCDIPQLYIA